jgi:acyl-CoA synthetase (AMP-forming)/AMP-acid ligase II
MPIVGITVDEAQAFCKWRTEVTGLLHRLPTETEWTLAAGPSDFPWGDKVNELKSIAVGRSMETGPDPFNAASDDITPTSIRHLLGNVSEFTTSTNGPHLIVKGANFTTAPRNASLKSHSLATRNLASLTTGFRSDFEDMTPPSGGAGEIVVSGDHVLKGYLNGVGDEETKFEVEGVRWHRTGDAGRLYDRGRLWLLGRCSAIVHDDRGVLYPLSVEVVARQQLGVRQAALLSVAGRRLLVVEPDPSGPPPDVSAIHRQLSWAKLDEVRFVTKIPLDRRHNAKIDYPRLKALMK